MRKLFFLILITTICGCEKKKVDDPFVLQFEKIADKYLICDSIKSTVAGISTVQVLGKGKGQDIMFHGDATFTIYSSPAQLLIFQLESPDKLYYYEDTRDPDVFYTVTSITDNSLVLQRSENTGRILTQYYRTE